MNLTPLEYEALERRMEAARRKRMPACKESLQEYTPAEREVGKGGLHEQIMEWCDAQWPRWKYIHARTDQKSTIGNGVHDFTIYAPNGRVFNIECKAKGGKMTPEQLAWSKELEMLGHASHQVVSLEQFVDLVSGGSTPRMGNDSQS